MLIFYSIFYLKSRILSQFSIHNYLEKEFYMMYGNVYIRVIHLFQHSNFFRGITQNGSSSQKNNSCQICSIGQESVPTAR